MMVIEKSKSALRHSSRSSSTGAALLLAAIGVSPAQNIDDSANLTWQKKALEHVARMRGFPDPDHAQPRPPTVIPEFKADPDPYGAIATLQPGGPTKTSQNAFFADLGTNDRTCFTCHQPQNGWSVSAQNVRDRFEDSDGKDPIFRLIDGANCPSANVTTLTNKRKAYSLLLKKGLIRIGLPVPDNAEYRIVSVNDPYGCNTDPVTGLTTIGLANPTTGIVSVYRRPLPSTNLGYLTAIMWDGREPSLESQSVDATLGHAQASAAPTTAQQRQIVDFETGLFTAQSRDEVAGNLSGHGAFGGPDILRTFLPQFYVGINDPVPNGTPPQFGNRGANGNGNPIPFSPVIFEQYNAWANLAGDDDPQERRRQIARGEQIFNAAPMTIARVTGINDTLNILSFSGNCGTCHDTPNVGNHSRKLPINIGIANGGPNNDNPNLDIGDLPVFNITCVAAGPLQGKTFVVTDLGRALISGKCADIGKFKGPILHGLSSRAPFFHNGSGTTFETLVDFYNDRFSMNLSPRDKADLVAFVKTL
jgi:cytochrome c peroxidase